MTEMTDPRFPDLRLVVKRRGLILDEILLDRDTLSVGDLDTLSVGRDPDCDVVLEDPAAPRRVAEFLFEEGGLWVVDSGSLWGISIGGKVISRRRLWPGEEVETGPFLIELRAGAEYSAPAEPTLLDAQVGFEDARTVLLPGTKPKPTLVMSDGSRIKLEDGTVVLGRGRECDVQLDSSAASKRHAELRVQGSAVTLVDLGSANGTRVNGEIVQEQVLANGDELALADVVVRIESAGHALVGRPGPQAVGNDPTVALSVARQEQIRAEAAAMAHDRIKIGGSPKKRRPLFVVAVVVAVTVAIVFCLIVVLVLARGQQAATEDPEPEPTVAAGPSRSVLLPTAVHRLCGSTHAAWNNGGL